MFNGHHIKSSLLVVKDNVNVIFLSENIRNDAYPDIQDHITTLMEYDCMKAPGSSVSDASFSADFS